MLATLEEAEAPVISCYLNLEGGETACRKTVDNRARLLRKNVGESGEAFVDEALRRIRSHMRTGLLPGAKGLAVFARGGRQPFFLPLQFRVPLPDWIIMGPTPNIYHLVELKDNYHRYVVALSTEKSARVLAINLGAVTQEVWRKRPDLRQRTGREWTQEHYQNHRRERTNQFINEQIAVIERLMSAGGYRHLILAGSPRMTARIRRALP